MRTLSWSRTFTMDRIEVEELKVWSLWQSRLYPYEMLSAGDELWTVEKQSGRRHVGWHTVVIKVVALPYKSHLDAADIMEDVFGVSQADFLTHPYTLGKRHQGFLLGAGMDPIRKVDRPLPSAIRLDQKGWTDLTGYDDTDLRRLGLLR